MKLYEAYEKCLSIDAEGKLTGTVELHFGCERGYDSKKDAEAGVPIIRMPNGDGGWKQLAWIGTFHVEVRFAGEAIQSLMSLVFTGSSLTVQTQSYLRREWSEDDATEMQLRIKDAKGLPVKLIIQASDLLTRKHGMTTASKPCTFFEFFGAEAMRQMKAMNVMGMTAATKAAETSAHWKDWRLQSSDAIAPDGRVFNGAQVIQAIRDGYSPNAYLDSLVADEQKAESA